MYGFGDPETWGGRSYEQSCYEIAYEKTDEEQCAKLKEALRDFPDEFIDLIIESDAWHNHIEGLVTERE